jgi:2-oxoglutarate ferredoxin oxidoreductase subunit delta
MKTGSVTVDGKGTGTGKSREKPRGRVSIDTERCKGCGYCVEFCPIGVLVMAARFNSKGYHYPEVAAAEKCTGCDLCGMYCPDFAVHSERVTGSGPAKE